MRRQTFTITIVRHGIHGVARPKKIAGIGSVIRPDGLDLNVFVLRQIEE